MNKESHYEIAQAALMHIQQYLQTDISCFVSHNLEASMYWDYTQEDLHSNLNVCSNPNVKGLFPDVRSDGALQRNIMDMFDNGYSLLLDSIKRIEASLSRGEIETAVKQLIVQSHYFGDAAQPVHAVETDVLDLLFERPKHLEYATLHSLVENKSGTADFAEYDFVPFEADDIDIALFIDQEVKKLKRKTGYLLPLILQAIYRDDAIAVKKYASMAVSNAAEVFYKFALLIFFNSACVKKGCFNSNLTKTAEIIELKRIIPENCVLDMCCNYRPMIDRTAVYGESSRQDDVLKIKGKQCGGVGGIPLSPLADPRKMPELPFPHGKCIGLIEYLINPNRTYLLTTTAGHNETTYNGGNIRVIIFTDGRIIYESGIIDSPAKAVDIMVNVKGQKLSLFAEDVDEAYPPLKYVVFREPTLQLIKKQENTSKMQSVCNK